MHSLQGNRTQLRPGFPIRTPSDQRFVDNSPRLNAVSHVLHRLSMPRHPPCALKQQTHTRITQHTKQNTHKQKTRCSRPLYSSHTPHPPPPTTTNAVTSEMMSHQGSTTPTQLVCRHHVSPQTPNSAPTNTQFSYQRFMLPCPHHPDSYRGGRVSTWISSKTLAAPRTGTQPTHPQLRAEIKAP